MKSRKGLSSVVGTVFSIIALITVVTYVTYSLNTLEKFNQEVISKNTELIDQGKEELEVVKSETANNKFNITVQNTGNLPLNITRLWIQNKTDPSWGTYKYDIKTAVSPGQVATNIGQNIDLYVLDTQAYEVKLTTERGSAEEFSINSPSQEPLYMKLFTLPEAMPSDFTTTVLFQVTNNMSNNNMLINIAPNPNDGQDSIGITPACTSCTVTRMSGPDPPSYPSLKVGDTATFAWVYKITTAVPGESATFTASLKNGISSNTATTKVNIYQVINSLQAGTKIGRAHV